MHISLVLGSGGYTTNCHMDLMIAGMVMRQRGPTVSHYSGYQQAVGSLIFPSGLRQALVHAKGHIQQPQGWSHMHVFGTGKES